MIKADLPEPIFKTEGLFTIVFMRDVKTSVKTSEEIMILIKENSKITIPEMSKQIGVTERLVERNINKLKIQGELKRIGPDKGGY